jgi:hypothetical protein
MMIYEPHVEIYNEGLTRHIDDRYKNIVHPDRWKWEYALLVCGIQWNEYQMRHVGIKMSVYHYRHQFKFFMNGNTESDIVTQDSRYEYLISSLQDEQGFTMMLIGVKIIIDDDLPDGRIILMSKFGAKNNCISFDWRGRMAYEEIMNLSKT